MIDSHAHISLFPVAEQSDALRRASEAGVHRILVPATGPEDLDEVSRIGSEFPHQVVTALGVHPHNASTLHDTWKSRLTATLANDGVLAVGEIGLDYYYDYSPREDQRRAFRWQLELARDNALPVILHQRDAWSDFLEDLDKVPGIRGVAHSFTEGPERAGEVLARGLFIGFSGMVTFPWAEKIRRTAQAVPGDRLLVETDSPYLAPAPHRGKRNEPAWVRVVAEKVARLRGVALEDLERSTDRAFGNLFESVS